MVTKHLKIIDVFVLFSEFLMIALMLYIVIHYPDASFRLGHINEKKQSITYLQYYLGGERRCDRHPRIWKKNSEYRDI